MHGLAWQLLKGKARNGVGSLVLNCLRQTESSLSPSADMKSTWPYEQHQLTRFSWDKCQGQVWTWCRSLSFQRAFGS